MSTTNLMRATHLTLSIAIAMAITLPVCYSSAAEASTQYTFDYKTPGKIVTTVFDDGQTTYLMLARGQSIGDVFVELSDGSKVPAVVQHGNPYLTITGIFASIEFKSSVDGTKQKIVYSGTVRASGTAMLQQDKIPSWLQPEIQSQSAATNAMAAAFSTPITSEMPPIANQNQALASENQTGQLGNHTAPSGAVIPYDSGRLFANIPFAAGSSVLGPIGRRTVKNIAQSSKKYPLTIAVSFDKDRDIEQARARGHALKSAFAKYGIKNIRWINAGGVGAEDGILRMAVYIGGETSDSSSVSMMPPVAQATPILAASYSQDNSTHIGATPGQAPIVTGSSDSPLMANSVPNQFSGASGIQVDHETAITIALAKIDSDYKLSVQKLHELFDQDLLSAQEFADAKQRLDKKRTDDKASLVAEREQLRTARLALEGTNLAQGSTQQQDPSVAGNPTATPYLAGSHSARDLNNVVNLKSAQVWIITPEDHSLRDVITRWAKAANLELHWEAPDFDINGSARIKGSIEEAINTVLSSLTSPDDAILARLYDNNVLRIASKDAMK